MKAIKLGADRAGPQSFQAVAEEWLKRHVEAKGLITGKERKRYLTKHILPEWAGRDFTSIKRSDIAKLLDKIEDKAGPTSADFALGVIRSICNFYASRNDDYSSPIIPGMRRTSSKENARTRILNDDEIRAIWKAAEANGTFGALVRLLLLTGNAARRLPRCVGRTCQLMALGRSGGIATEGNSGRVSSAAASHRDHQGPAPIRVQPLCACWQIRWRSLLQLRQRQKSIRRQAARDAAMGFARLAAARSLFNEFVRVSAPILQSEFSAMRFEALRVSMTGTNTATRRPTP